MNTVNNIQEELQSMGSVLAGMSRSMPYAVPVGYFEHFDASVKNIIKDISEADVVPGWNKTLPYTIPAGYFEGLSNNLVAKATAEALPKEVPFSAPAGYFETLPAQLLQAAKATDTRIIPLKRRNILQPIKWAAAAILVLGIGLGSYRIFFNMPQASGTENILSSVPSTDIQDYIQNNYRVDVDRLVANNSVNNMNLDNKDIVQYLNETGWD